MSQIATLVDHKKERIEDKEFSTNTLKTSFSQKEFIKVYAVKKTFEDVDFSQCSFTACYFRNCRFIRCNFTGSSFKETYLKGSRFPESIFKYTTFEKSPIDDSILDTGLSSSARKSSATTTEGEKHKTKSISPRCSNCLARVAAIIVLPAPGVARQRKCDCPE